MGRRLAPDERADPQHRLVEPSRAECRAVGTLVRRGVGETQHHAVGDNGRRHPPGAAAEMNRHTGDEQQPHPHAQEVKPRPVRARHQPFEHGAVDARLPPSALDGVYGRSRCHGCRHVGRVSASMVPEPSRRSTGEWAGAPPSPPPSLIPRSAGDSRRRAGRKLLLTSSLPDTRFPLAPRTPGRSSRTHFARACGPAESRFDRLRSWRPIP